MKHRHKLSQRQRQKATSQSRRSEAQETDEQPRSGAGKAKKSAMHHLRAEGGRTKLRLDKFRRGGRSRNRYDNGGPAGSSAVTRSADDPGGELATATRERKSTLGRIQDELLGPKSAYVRGGRQKFRGYDIGGATPSIFSPPTQQDLITTPKQNYVASLVQKAGQPMAARGAAALASLQKNTPSFPGSPKVPVPANKQGGRIKRQQQRRHYDDGGIADAFPARPPALAFGDGPPAPPRLSSDGTIGAAPPRANDPSFVNRLNASQKNAQLKQRVRQLEGKGR